MPGLQKIVVVVDHIFNARLSSLHCLKFTSALSAFPNVTNSYDFLLIMYLNCFLTQCYNCFTPHSHLLLSHSAYISCVHTCACQASLSIVVESQFCVFVQSFVIMTCISFALHLWVMSTLPGYKHEIIATQPIVHKHIAKSLQCWMQGSAGSARRT